MCIISLPAYTQIVVDGTIRSSDREPVLGASIVVQPISGTNVLAFAISDENGSFRIQIKESVDSALISVSGFNIVKQTKAIAAKSQTINFTIEETFIELKEVQIKSNRIWGNKDTINYLVSSFSDAKDLVIGDVLRKMPGIDVAESGAISYNGKPINKFYIENLDMLQGRYGIATNNISAKDVSTVQVLENHQPIKALDSVRFSADPAINLRLKDGAKGTLSIMAQLGIGTSPFLWENELAGMYFAKGKQNMATYKGNNSGQDLSNELRSFTYSDLLAGNEMIDIQMPSSPAINQKRYLFNNSNAATFNNLKEFSPGKQLHFNLFYLNDHEKRSSLANSAYYLPGDSLLVIDETLNSTRNIDRLESEIRYNVNDDQVYLDEYLKIGGSWENSSGDVFNGDSINQHLYRPTFFISNAFHWINKKENNKGFEFTSNTGFRTTPQTLTIRPGIYSDVFNFGNDYPALQQELRLNVFRTVNDFSLLSIASINKIIFSERIGFEIESQNLNSELNPINVAGNPLYTTPDSLMNNLDWMKAATWISSDISFQHNRFKLNLSLPVSYNILYLHNHVQTEKRTQNRVFFQPAVNMQYVFNSRFTGNIHYRFSNNLGNIQTLYPSYILLNYRNLNAYDGRLSEAKSNGGSLDFSYKDLINMLFMNISGNYNRMKLNMLHGQEFIGIMNIATSIEQDNTSESFSGNAKLSKGFYFWNITSTIEGNYGQYTSEQLNQGELVKFRNNGGNVSLSLTAQPSQWLLLDYKGTWGQNNGRIISGEKFQAIQSSVNNINMDFSVLKNLSMNIGYEHYYNSASMSGRYFSFTDFEVRYIWKDIRFSLDWMNIFDANSYVTAYYSSIDTYRYIYDIRPTTVMLKVRLKLK